MDLCPLGSRGENTLLNMSQFLAYKEKPTCSNGLQMVVARLIINWLIKLFYIEDQRQVLCSKSLSYQSQVKLGSK